MIEITELVTGIVEVKTENIELMIRMTEIMTEK